MSADKLILSKKKKCDINRDMVGLFFEDINFAADGGLYAELLENRSFEAIRTKGKNRDYILTEDSLYAWTANSDEAELEISCNMPVSDKNPHYLRFSADKAGAGFYNKAYDGLALKAGLKYKVSFYAKVIDFYTGDVKVSFRKDEEVISERVVKLIVSQPTAPADYDTMVGNCESNTWVKYETELISSKDVTGAVFEISLTQAGCVEFDLFSVIPEDAVCGIFRKDLFEALADLNPGFLRFPGGCIVEGTSLLRRYRWKDTVGPVEHRKINTNLWAAVGGNTSLASEMPDSHYMQSYGIGFYEYFLLCELLSKKRKCKAVPVLNIGVACQFRTYETVAIDSPEFDMYVQDALDLIEFANGPVDSKWGSLRASMGHPESFDLEMIAIGNEQWESRHVNVAERYRIFEKAIHEKYPEIKCLGTAGPFVKEPLYDLAWKNYRDEIKSNPSFTYAVDEHYYVEPKWLYDNVTFYDEYPRDIKVFAGEYAAHDANQSNSVEAGIAEAAMLTGMERNGDVVKLASYAPLFNRIGHSHWTPDMIWFDESKVVFTPSYYVQKAFSDYAGDEALELDGQEKTLRDRKLYISAVLMDGKVVLKVVNAASEMQTLSLADDSDEAVSCTAQTVTVAAANGEAKVPVATEAVDTINNHAVSIEKMSNKRLCELRAPEESSYTVEEKIINGEYSFPAKSLTVLVLDL